MANFHIRSANADDATAVSKVILAALRETWADFSWRKLSELPVRRA